MALTFTPEGFVAGDPLATFRREASQADWVSLAQVKETDWVFSFDMEPDLAIRTRKQIIDRAELEDAIVGICHHSGFGRIIRSEGKRYWQGL